MTEPAPAEPADLSAFRAAAGRARAARDRVGAVVLGQEEVVTLALAALLAGGHALLVGAPGLAKTLLATTMAEAVGLDTKRIQFTPDLMPADILGSEVLDQDAAGARAFRFIEGPVFCQLLMADEINRASPRTQAALLQAMQEGFCTVAGERRDLPQPFHVLATQNPIEQDGTYPLPEAQLDRFLVQINVGYPDEKAERAMLRATTGALAAPPVDPWPEEALKETQAFVRAMPIGEKTADAALSLVRAGRPGPGATEAVNRRVAWGPGPRGGQAVILVAKALAFLDGREAPDLEDVRAAAKPTLRHRFALTFAALEDGIDADGLIDELVDATL
ncbi:MAG: MoxR family ATPase [Pseudomonadota bacterium]